MTCRIVHFLYRLLPFTFWHAFWIRTHFSGCPECSREFEIEQEFYALTVKPEQIAPNLELWKDVRQTLAFQSQRMSLNLRQALQRFGVIFLILAVVIFALITFLILSGKIT